MVRRKCTEGRDDGLARIELIHGKRVTGTVVTALSIAPSVGREAHQRRVGSTQIESLRIEPWTNPLAIVFRLLAVGSVAQRA